MPLFAFRILFTTKNTKSTKRLENKIDPSCPFVFFVVKSVRLLSVANIRLHRFFVPESFVLREPPER